MQEILNRGDPQEIAKYMKENGLIFKEGKITHPDNVYTKEQIRYWDKIQLVKKILLNS